MAIEFITIKDSAQADRNVACDNDSGNYYQVVKIVLGSDGSFATVLAPGQVAKSASIPVVIASDQDYPNYLNGSMAVAAVSVTSSATELVTAGSAPLANRKKIIIYNNGTQTVYLGPSGVSASSGIPLLAGGSWEDNVGPSVDIFAITSSGTCEVRVCEFA